ncbi:MAG: hypothetical protein ACPGMR_03375 [Pontibacterium sp.]
MSKIKAIAGVAVVAALFGLGIPVHVDCNPRYLETNATIHFLSSIFGYDPCLD